MGAPVSSIQGKTLIMGMNASPLRILNSSVSNIERRTIATLRTIAPAYVAPVASARGAALLAGLAAGVFGPAEKTPQLAPEPGRIVRPGRDRTSYEAAYERYGQLYPRLRG